MHILLNHSIASWRNPLALIISKRKKAQVTISLICSLHHFEVWQVRLAMLKIYNSSPLLQEYLQGNSSPRCHSTAEITDGTKRWLLITETTQSQIVIRVLWYLLKIVFNWLSTIVQEVFPPGLLIGITAVSLVIGTMPAEHFLELSKEETTLWLNAGGPAPHTLIKRSRLTSMLQRLLSTGGMRAPSVPAVDSTSSCHSNSNIQLHFYQKWNFQLEIWRKTKLLVT